MTKPKPGPLPKCTATSQTTGERCRQAPIAGGSVCVTHGGRAPQVRAAATARVEKAKLAAEMTRAAVTFGARRDIDPVDGLLELVALGSGHVAWLAARVAELDPKVLTVGVAEQRIAADGAKTVVIRSAPHVLLGIYRDERRLFAEVCAATARAGVEDRSVRLAERQGELLARVIAAVLADPELGLSEAQRARANETVPRHLRAVADDEAAGVG